MAGNYTEHYQLSQWQPQDRVLRTEFNQVAGVEFFTSGMSAQKAAKIAIDGMFSEKREIIPGAMMKWVRALTRVAPTALQLRVSHYLQHRKTEKSS